MKKEYTFRLRVKQLLIEKGLTQTELAKMTGLRQATISEMVNNQRTIINKDHLALIMDALNLTSLNDILELHITEK